MSQSSSASSRSMDRAGAGKFTRQFGGKGLDDRDTRPVFARQRGGDEAGGAFAEVVDVGLEGEAEARDAGVGMRGDERVGMGDDVVDFAVVDAARGADQRAFLWGAGDDEPWVDGDAMAADAGAG